MQCAAATLVYLLEINSHILRLYLLKRLFNLFRDRDSALSAAFKQEELKLPFKSFCRRFVEIFPNYPRKLQETFPERREKEKNVLPVVRDDKVIFKVELSN